MKKQVLIIDDFLDDPVAARSLALSLSYRNLNNTGMYSEYHATGELIGHMSECLGVPLATADPNGTGRFNYRLGNEKFAFDIHVDHCDWGGILYLNPPQQCEGGTVLWKHRATGLTEWPDDARGEEIICNQACDDLWDYFVMQQGLDRNNWEPQLAIPMKFNRLVLFRGMNFHSHAHYFGTTLETARLVQIFFFNEDSFDSGLTTGEGIA